MKVHTCELLVLPFESGHVEVGLVGFCVGQRRPRAAQILQLPVGALPVGVRAAHQLRQHQQAPVDTILSYSTASVINLRFQEKT